MRRVTVVIHQEPEGWWAESPDLDGWSAAAESLDALREQIRGGLEFFLDDTVETVEEFAGDRDTITIFGVEGLVRLQIATSGMVIQSSRANDHWSTATTMLPEISGTRDKANVG